MEAMRPAALLCRAAIALGAYSQIRDPLSPVRRGSSAMYSASRPAYLNEDGFKARLKQDRRALADTEINIGAFN